MCIEDDIIETWASGIEPGLGNSHIDKLVADFMIKQAKKNQKLTSWVQPKSMFEFLVKCEAAKKALSRCYYVNIEWE